MSSEFDAMFRRAVECIDRGEVDGLRQLLDTHSELASERLTEAPAWLRDQVGDATDGFFNRPYLLWFVAEDPIRNGSLPNNIADVIRAIVAAVRRSHPESLQEQLDSTLQLVCWSGVAADCGLQLDMIDVLVDEGAAPGKNPDNALVNGHVAAAARLLQRGATLTLGAALCLGRWSEAERLFVEASAEVKQFSFVLAALNGQAEGVSWMIKRGVPLDEPSADLYSHGTPLHHAVCSGSADTVRVLVEAGADVSRADTAWNATPLGWAEHYEESTSSTKQQDYTAIAHYLRDRVRKGARATGY